MSLNDWSAWRAALALAVACSAIACTSQPQTAPADAAAIARIETSLVPRIVIESAPTAPMSMTERMAFYHVPGVSLAFFDDTHILWTREYGIATAGSPAPVTPDTIFQASSISKVTTALATLRLVRDGILTLDEDVNLKLKSWKIPDTPFTATEKVTIRRLLSHSAGVTVNGFPGYAHGVPLPTTTQILQGAGNSPAITVDIVPGTAYRYSGGGYVVLQQLIEDVTGEPMSAVLDRLVLKPAGMAHSTFAQPLPASLMRTAASGHEADGKPLPGGSTVLPEVAPAGLWSTPSDLARLAIELGDELEGRSDHILNKQLATEMLTRTSGTWGLGVNVGSGPERMFTHNGNNSGFQSVLIYSADRKQGFALMTNGNNQSGFLQEIIMAVAKEYGWPGFDQVVRKTVPVSADILQQYTGRWLAEGAPEYDVKVEDGKLFAQGGPFGPLPVELHAQSQTAFFILSTGFTFDFTQAAENKATLGGYIKAVRKSGP